MADIQQYKAQRNQLEQSLSGTESKFLTIRGEENERAVKQAIAMEAVVFIKSSYPATDAELVSKEFAKEIFTRKDWNLEEVKAFFRFVKDRANEKEFKILGNYIGLMHLMGFIILYEEHRSEARESRHQAYKNEESTQPLPVPKEYIEKILRTINGKEKPQSNEIITREHKPAFDPVINAEHFELFKAIIPEGTTEDKKKWKASIADFYSISDEEMNRKKELIELLT